MVVGVCSCSCRLYKIVQCFYGNATVRSVCTVVEVQNMRRILVVVNSYRRLEEVRLCLQRRGILRTVDCRGLEDEGSKLLPNAG